MRSCSWEPDTVWSVPEFGVFLVRVFPDWILPKYSLNAGKYGPEKLQMRTLFTQCDELWSKASPSKERKASKTRSNSSQELYRIGSLKEISINEPLHGHILQGFFFFFALRDSCLIKRFWTTALETFRTKDLKLYREKWSNQVIAFYRARKRSQWLQSIQSKRF